MAGVSLRGVKKSYDGKVDVIHGIDMEIADGEFIVIVGPSGCGKSTLLRMIAGLERITGGDVAIGERVVNTLEPKDRDIAMVFQNYALYPHMSVYDNMAYGLRIRGMSKAEIEQRVQKAARILELSGLLQRKPRQLSGGQRQRVAMGRAIVREPAVFLFDEPLSNLDAKLRVQMRLEIKRLQRELGTTSVYVTHDQVEAMTLADQLIVMNAGRAEQIGTPMDVYEKPASTFVAGFIGSPAMNFLSGRVGTDRRSVSLATADQQHVTLRLSGAIEGEPDRAVTLGVRPEHLLADGGDGAIALQIEMVEPLGADTLLHGHFGESREGVTVRMPGHVQVKGGESRRFNVDAANVHLFDADSGRRIALV
ncbi:sn-glycerol-3-phosphate import ATP-binding protein UgpC [Vineibacter terrae]|uniref:sn-glycerol-3-phosphate import ATP-binding protein UgpC n=1 Tax=Vineibacter terrae TaxID=2586908 RepID=A0A5C8PAA9_9HYPH|nr:sn-glycerol-3-phosphate import ATP-binding protein UgpC [Vineibacter terrae]TXL70485.1 sn-glycerol-3-phosphate import ATP-binding protein UgpC [Vineibacter terrae]